MPDRIAALVSEFCQRFGPSPGPRIARGPGRVNLIGEHTDYNGGFVLPIAIDRDVAIAFRANGTDRVRLYSMDFEQDAEWSLTALAFDPDRRWTNYVRGVAQCMQEASLATEGFDGVVQGNVPIGSGLSSSAAFEVAAAQTFLDLSGQQLDPRDMALLCQRAENTFVGVNCGIMDQFISVFGQAGHAVLIDCRSLEHQLVPVGDGHARIVVCDTSVKRELAASAYNERRAQCEEAARVLNAAVGGVEMLRDVTPDALAAHSDKLDPVVLKRARHVVSEDERTTRGVAMLQAGNLAEFGRLMNASHDSLRDDYEVSCEELDAMVTAARAVGGVFGARMTGAGFGGCTVNLVTPDAVDEFCERVPAAYKASTGLEAKLYVCEPAQGARVHDAPSP